MAIVPENTCPFLPGVDVKAQPYFFAGQETGFLLVHGFTGSPPELRPLGEYLAQQGSAVYAPLLAGHGTQLQDLRSTTWLDWLESAAEGLAALRQKPVKRIILVGLSMGGLLSLCLAHQALKQADPIPVMGVGTLNSPIFLLNLGVRLRREIMPQDFDQLNGEAAQNLRFTYAQNPLTGVRNLRKLIRQVQRILPKIQMPALVVQSRVDERISPMSGLYIYRNLGSQQKQILWLDRAPHVLTVGSEQERVYQEIVRWSRLV